MMRLDATAREFEGWCTPAGTFFAAGTRFGVAMPNSKVARVLAPRPHRFSAEEIRAMPEILIAMFEAHGIKPQGDCEGGAAAVPPLHRQPWSHRPTSCGGGRGTRRRGAAQL